MGGDRGMGGGGGAGATDPPPPLKFTSCHLFPSRKLERISLPPPPPPPPLGVVWICTSMSGCGILFFIIFFLHVTGLAIILSSVDAQADLRLCCLHATQSGFSQQGTYGMG